MVALVGLVCSSFVVVNAGTSMRSQALPLGDPTQPTVQVANLLAARFVGGGSLLFGVIYFERESIQFG